MQYSMLLCLALVPCDVAYALAPSGYPAHVDSHANPCWPTDQNDKPPGAIMRHGSPAHASVSADGIFPQWISHRTEFSPSQRRLKLQAVPICFTPSSRTVLSRLRSVVPLTLFSQMPLIFQVPFCRKLYLGRSSNLFGILFAQSLLTQGRACPLAHDGVLTAHAASECAVELGAQG